MKPIHSLINAPASGSLVKRPELSLFDGRLTQPQKVEKNINLISLSLAWLVGRYLSDLTSDKNHTSFCFLLPSLTSWESCISQWHSIKKLPCYMVYALLRVLYFINNFNHQNMLLTCRSLWWVAQRRRLFIFESHFSISDLCSHAEKRRSTVFRQAFHLYLEQLTVPFHVHKTST